MIIVPIYWSLMILFFMVFLFPLFNKLSGMKGQEFEGMMVFIAMSASFVILLTDLPNILAGEVLIYQMGSWSPPFGIVLAVDAFNYLVALLILGMGALTSLYTVKHVKIVKGLTKFYTLLLLFIAGMLGVALTGDLFNLYVFFEIASISAYALVAFHVRAWESLEGGFKYLITGSMGTSFILIAIAFLYGLTGTLNMADLAVKLSLFDTSIIPTLAFALMIVGFSVKAVLVPMHAWKPDALTGAHAGVAALIAGAASSLGLYSIFRVVYTISSVSMSLISVLIALSVITMIVGALMALVQTDLKRLLVYSSISQSGYIALGLALAAFTVTGAVGGLFHMVNYVLATTLLFFCAGIIIHRTGTQNMDELGGLAQKMPFLAMAFMIGALSIVGIPLLNGFVSKWTIYSAGLEAGFSYLTIIAMVTSVITMAYFAKAIYKIFFGVTHRSLDTKRARRKISLTISVPIFVLVALSVLLGVLPQVIMPLLNEAAIALTAKTVYIQAVLG